MAYEVIARPGKMTITFRTKLEYVITGEDLERIHNLFLRELQSLAPKEPEIKPHA